MEVWRCSGHTEHREDAGKEHREPEEGEALGGGTLPARRQPPSGEELAGIAALSANQGGARAAKLFLVLGNQ